MSGSAHVMIPEPICSGPLPAAEQAAVVEGFMRDGCYRLPGLLAGEADELREAVDGLFALPLAEQGDASDEILRFRAFEHDRRFRDLLVREPLISIVEAILGANCHMISQNVLRTPPGRAIDQWHVDEALYFPLPEDMPRHPMALPVLVLTVFVLLSEVPDEAAGPTQIVPGSCWSGRHPPIREPIAFQGRGPLSLLGHAGDCYLMHNQCWHRGSPNTSASTRYLIGTNYGRRFVSQRLHPFVNYQLPAQVEAGADGRLRRVLGHHPKGTEGYA